MGSLSNLKWLLLSANELSGEIPPERGHLSNLTLLWLHDNQFAIRHPWAHSERTR